MIISKVSAVLFVSMLLLQAVGFAIPQTSLLALTPAPRSEFRQSIEDAQGNCPDLKCPQSSVTLKTLTTAEWASQSKEIQDFINQQVVERSAAWDDTILESDYYSTDAATLGDVASVSRGSELIGYRMSFQTRAWDTGSCPFDPENPDVESCDQGLIVDAAFLSVDLKEVFQDQNSFAHFVPNEGRR